jgi:hypothetical protein
MILTDVTILSNLNLANINILGRDVTSKFLTISNSAHATFDYTV